MSKWTKVIVYGAVMAAVSMPALAREETWKLTYWPAPWLTEIKSTWHVTISDSGKITGVSVWDAHDSSGNPNLSGRKNTIEGSISKNGDITLVRHLAGQNAGKSQHYTGQYTNSGTGAKGDTTGFDAPGSWDALITVGAK